MGYGDVRPEDTNRTRIGTMCIVLLGVITCLAGLVLLAEFFMDLHQQFMAKARGASGGRRRPRKQGRGAALAQDPTRSARPSGAATVRVCAARSARR